MKSQKEKDFEAICEMVVKSLATSPAGRNLALIGGFRYRFLDGSVRSSRDIDYHWGGKLEEKQNELLEFFGRALIPDVSRSLGYSGRVDPRRGPDADSPAVKIVDLAFWKESTSNSRIEIPVEITRIACADSMEVRTSRGTVYPTPSDADMVESKIIAILNRQTVTHRDIVDVFLFQDSLVDDSQARLQKKFEELKISADAIKERMEMLEKRKGYHIRSTQEIIDTQLEETAAVNLNSGGGGEMVFDAVVDLIKAST